jgi:SulP family sulfate permease
MTSSSLPKPRRAIVGDVWGGVASSLVALPASIAFGVAVYAPLGAGAGAGALAGLLGATALGTIAPLLGGTPRLVSAPCAPAVAVMAAFALHTASHAPGDPARVMVLMTLVGLVAATLQIGLGLARAGTIIKYIPYPVVTGYMSGVGLVILLKQLPSLLGLAKGTSLGHGLSTPALWQWPSLVVGGATIVVMALAPRVTKAIPAAILGLAAGLLAYLALALLMPELRTLTNNAFVIGPLDSGGPSFGDAFRARFESLGGLQWSDAGLVFGPALTLAVVLSLDTLKTCVVVDAFTGSQHDSNRELFGQGVANAVSATIGGMPGAGTSGATLVNVASGAQTRWSAVIEGGLVLFAFLTLGGVVAWAPLAALAGILVVVAYRMFDWHALTWVRHRTTTFDFVVVVVVIGVAVGVDLISASAVGVALSILLFIRNESRGAVIRRKLEGNRVFSKRRRLPAELAVLSEHGHETVVVQLAGSLFFGTTDQLRKQLKDDLETRRTIIFDLRMVDALDLTAAHILAQMLAKLAKRGGHAVFCNLPRTLAGQSDVPRYLREVGLIDDRGETVFANLSDALASAEDQTLRDHGGGGAAREGMLEVLDLPIFAGRKQDTVADMTGCIEERHVAPGEYVFRRGDTGDEIYFVRTGTVRISLALEARTLHIASFGRGDFFGEMAFLDGGARSADAIAETVAELFVISRKRFDAVAATHPRLAQAVFASIARTLALRLRTADAEITTLEEA